MRYGDEDDMGRGKDHEWWVMHNSIRENWMALSLRNLDYIYIKLHDHKNIKHFRKIMDNNGDYWEECDDELLGLSR